VVHVEVDDGDACPAPRQGLGGGHGDVVEQAEAHGAVRFRVMAGRTHRAEGAIQAALEHALDRVRHRARRLEGGGVGVRSRVRVGVELPRPPRRRRHRGHVVGGVHAKEFLARRVARGEELEARIQALAPDPLAQRGQALRPLRMARPRVVLEEHGIVVEPDLHQCRERSSLAAAVSLGRTSNTSPTIP
jgi:hypothetical protein